MGANTNKRWSDEDDTFIQRLERENRLTQREIANLIGRTESGVNSRLIILRKRLDDEQ